MQHDMFTNADRWDLDGWSLLKFINVGNVPEVRETFALAQRGKMREREWVIRENYVALGWLKTDMSLWVFRARRIALFKNDIKTKGAKGAKASCHRKNIHKKYKKKPSYYNFINWKSEKIYVGKHAKSIDYIINIFFFFFQQYLDSSVKGHSLLAFILIEI